MSLIFIHELGHFLTAFFLGWKTDKICLYPYGGISLFKQYVNVHRKEEWLVLIMGPLFQIVFFNFVYPSLDNLYLRNIFSNYHLFLLIFNLLPVYPLDGGKIFLLILSYFNSYRNSFILVIYFSYFIVILLCGYFFISKTFILVGVLIILYFKIKKEKQQFPYIFQKFLLERTLYNFSFKKRKVIHQVNDMMLDTFHYFNTSNGLVDEKEYLISRSFKKLYK